MSRAEELLSALTTNAGKVSLASTLSNNAVGLSLSDASPEPHIVIADDRYVSVPDELKRIAVQYDHDIETVTFDCPRYWDEHDMSTMRIYINYLRADAESGCYKAQDITVDEADSSIMHFTWTVSRNVTEAFGKIVFLVCVKKADADGNETNHWNSELCKDCYVSEGLEYDIEPTKELYPDLVEQWYKEVLGVLDEVNTVKQGLIDMRDAGDFDGATFTPSVNDACDLSWTNNKGLANPATVNIKGDTGFAPTITVTNISGGYRLTITDVNETKTVDVMDTILDDSEAVTKLLNDYVYVGSVEPTSGPVLWLDTTSAESVVDATIKYKDSSGNIKVVNPTTLANNVDGLDEAIRDQSVITSGTGSAYTATVEGITALTAGVSFVMVPHVVSAANNPTLDVNGLGAKYIRRRVSNSSSTTTTGASDTWLAANKPIRVTYDGTFWIADLPKPNATDLMGAVPIQNGGTGAGTSNNARINLGVTDTYGAIISNGYCYTECRQWADNNTSSEDRTYYFVCNDTNTASAIRKATTADDILGVTVAQIYGDAGFVTGYDSSNYTNSGALLPAYSYVAVRGLVKVFDGSTCVAGDRCMPNDDGVAEPVDGDYGYLVLGRSDDNHVLIYLDPSVSTAQYKLKQQVDNSHSIKTATLTTTWVGDSAPYTQTVTVTGIKADDCPHITPVYSSTVATAIEEKEAWGMVSKAEVTAVNTITFTCFEDKPTVPINLQIEVNR